MNALLDRFKTKAALAKVLNVTPPAVHRAFKRNVVPATWVPTLLKQGLSQSDISALPLDPTAADILAAIANQQHHGADHGTAN